MLEMRKKSLGFSLIEVLGALAVGGIMTVGLSTVVTASMEDTKGQQAALYQAQVVAAANKYISNNFTALSAAINGNVPAVVTLDMLKAENLLSGGVGNTNAYGQTPCVLILKTSAVNASGATSTALNALIVTEGGTAIDDLELGSIAAKSGHGGGFISSTEPNVARGAYNSWNITAQTTPRLPNFLSRNCSGTRAASGRLASALFFEGSEQLPADYLYRSEFPGQPELNQMHVPLHMMPGTGAQATEGDASDSRCTVADGTGKIAVDAQGRILSCQQGVWRGQGSGQWKDPVANNLPNTDNSVGDVRMVTSLGRAFMWDGTQWAALGVDMNGNMRVPETLTAKKIQLTEVAANNDACSSDGLLARDSSGAILSCKSGRWRNAAETRIITPAVGQYAIKLFGGEPIIGILKGKERITVPAISLADLPGPRPLYMSGWMTCHSNTDRIVTVRTVVKDAQGNALAFPGMCTSQSYTPNLDYETAANVPLMKLPDNAATIDVYMEVSNNSEDLATLTLLVFNSE